MSRRSSEELQKRRPGRKQSGGASSWQGFVDLELTSAQKDHLAALGEEDFPDLYSFLKECLADGYKLSFVSDFKHHCVISTLTGKGDGNPNQGYSLSARGPDLDRSVLVLYYKHIDICDGERWAEHAETNVSGRDAWG